MLKTVPDTLCIIRLRPKGLSELAPTMVVILLIVPPPVRCDCQSDDLPSRLSEAGDADGWTAGLDSGLLECWVPYSHLREVLPPRLLPLGWSRGARKGCCCGGFSCTAVTFSCLLENVEVRWVVALAPLPRFLSRCLGLLLGLLLPRGGDCLGRDLADFSNSSAQVSSLSPKSDPEDHGEQRRARLVDTETSLCKALRYVSLLVSVIQCCT